ncbi:MAG: phage tail sheath subtilisin-like domain-containing protein [Myxococcota bacterium]
MPEYLAPGVFVEELPPSLRAIEGVSTSTAAVVGPTDRGPVAGGDLPFQPTDGFQLQRDTAPLLVTSFGDYVRSFGPPLRLPADTDPEDRGYVGHAVRAFFDNGGKRVYVARVVDGATRNTVTLGQGVALRLLRSARAGDSVVALNSLRSLAVGTTLVFRRRSDGTDALVQAATAAAQVGTSIGPWALVAGDTVDVTVSGSPVVSLTPVAATPADVAAAAAGPYAIAVNDTVQVRVGPSSAPTQTATFLAGDLATPGAVTASEVALVLARDVKGAAVSVDGGGVVHLVSDQAGSGARIEVLGGAAAAALGFPATTVGTGNVADVDHVSFAEIVALFGGANAGIFDLSTTGGGKLQLVSVATGVGVTLTVSGAPGALSRLGLAGASVPGAGGGPAPVVTVASYDTLRGTVALSAPLPAALDKALVWVAPSSAPVAAGGPRFHARSPGSWSRGVAVQVQPADRAPVPVTLAAPPASTTVQVQSATSFYVGAIVEVDHDGQLRTTHEVMAITGTTLTLDTALGAAVLAIPGARSHVRVLEIDVVVADETGAAPTETYRGLTWNPRDQADVRIRHYATQINARSRLVYVQPPGTGLPLLAGSEGADGLSQPATGDAFPALLSDTAVDGIPAKGPAGDAAIVGLDGGPGARTGIEALVDVDDVRIVLAPGQVSDTVQLALISHCERMRYRFAVLDGERDPDAVDAVLAHRDLYDTSFAAYYSPWVSQNVDGEVRFLPPSGAVAGIYARVDNQRGVWKAPANETVSNVRDLRIRWTTGEQEVLNPRGVNLIRRFDEGGIRVWGARTLSSDPSVKYVNVRRTLQFLEASIEGSTSWVVFEINAPQTWDRVVATVRAFLRTQWREGALLGRTEEQAFYVRCDESTMTADDIQNGRLICRIGVAIVRPAEFVIFRIEQLTGFGQEG